MAATLTVASIIGTPKILDGQFAALRSSVSDMLNNKNAKILSLQSIVNQDNPDIILLEQDDEVVISFSPDSTGDDEQGLKCYQNAGCKVESVSGSVYVISNEVLNYSDGADDAYTNPNRIVASKGNKVNGGYILGGKSDNFSVKFSGRSGGVAILLPSADKLFGFNTEVLVDEEGTVRL